MDLLSTLNAKINIADSILEIPKTAIPILTRPNPVDTLHTVPSNSKIRLSLPVNFMQGDFIYGTTDFDNQLSITGGLYTATTGIAYFEVCNNSDYNQTLYLEEPLVAEELPLQDYGLLHCMPAMTDTTQTCLHQITKRESKNSTCQMQLFKKRN